MQPNKKSQGRSSGSFGHLGPDQIFLPNSRWSLPGEISTIFPVKLKAVQNHSNISDVSDEIMLKQTYWVQSTGSSALRKKYFARTYSVGTSLRIRLRLQLQQVSSLQSFFPKKILLEYISSHVHSLKDKYRPWNNLHPGARATKKEAPEVQSKHSNSSTFICPYIMF